MSNETGLVEVESAVGNHNNTASIGVAIKGEVMKTRNGVVNGDRISSAKVVEDWCIGDEPAIANVDIDALRHSDVDFRKVDRSRFFDISDKAFNVIDAAATKLAVDQLADVDGEDAAFVTLYRTFWNGMKFAVEVGLYAGNDGKLHTFGL